jgi:hypothetical protein
VGDSQTLGGAGVQGSMFAGMNWWNIAKHTSNFTPVWPGY